MGYTANIEVERLENSENILRESFLRRLFRRMAEGGSFSVEGVAQLMRSMGGDPGVGRDDAWSALYSMLEANCLVERRGILGEARKYSSQVPYSLHVSPESSFQCRGAAVRQMHDHDAAAAARMEATAQAAAAVLAAPAAPPPPTTADHDLELVQGFITERCVVGADEAVSEILLRAKFVAWEEDRGAEPSATSSSKLPWSVQVFETTRGKFTGLRLKLLRELQALEEATS
jgi:hypothetical protein